jgi:hypothetical protein
MSRNWWTILRFAILGLVVAAIFFGLLETKLLMDGPLAIWVIGVALLLCPGFIPFAWAASAEMQMPSFARIWLIVGVINFLFYAAIGTVYVRFRNWRAGTARI